jgi:hypothetical protein
MDKPPFDDLEEIRGWIAAQNDLLIALVAWVPNKEGLISALLRKRELGVTKLLNSPVSDGLRASYEAAMQALVDELRRYLSIGGSQDSQSPGSSSDSTGHPKDPG